MGDLNLRINTSNQVTADYDYEKLLLGDNIVKLVTFVNDTGAELSISEGLVLGRITDAGANNLKIKAFDSTNTDGSQNILGVLMNDYTLAIAEEFSVGVIVSGKVNSNKVSLSGTDTLDTIVSGKTIGDRIMSDTLGVNMVESTDLAFYDN